MKPQSPSQLARLLDQISGAYPNGIPVRSMVPSGPSEVLQETLPRYHFFLVGDGDPSPTNQELLEGIASKGLRLSKEDYQSSVIPQSKVAAEVASCPSERVIVFGAVDGMGSIERVVGAPALMTYSLERLSMEPALKRELWHSLQAFLTPA